MCAPGRRRSPLQDRPEVDIAESNPSLVFASEEAMGVVFCGEELAVAETLFGPPAGDTDHFDIFSMQGGAGPMVAEAPRPLPRQRCSQRHRRLRGPETRPASERWSRQTPCRPRRLMTHRGLQHAFAPPCVKPRGVVPPSSLSLLKRRYTWQARDVEGEARALLVPSPAPAPATPPATAARDALSTPQRPPTKMRFGDERQKMDIIVIMLREQRLDTQTGFTEVARISRSPASLTSATLRWARSYE